MLLYAIVIAQFYYASVVFASTSKQPNIIFILADDLGWNDVSFHGSPEIPTPNIDALAASGIILNNYYSASQCTPSRASLMTGKYAFKTGLQHHVIRAGEPIALPLEMTILPQHLKKLGYATHLVGKWHLGFFNKEYTPTYRGFDTFFGYWNGVIDYYDYTSFLRNDIPGINAMWGIDLHNGTDVVRDFRGRYATEVFTEKATEVISGHDESQPLFLFISHLAPHVGNSYHPRQALPAHVAKFSHIKDKERRTYAGMVSSLDESIGKVFSALSAKGMLDNSIIVFSSDNGAESVGVSGGKGSNWPLRGMKFYLWEGGIRVPTVVWSPLLNLEEPRISTQMMHISDWLPTFYHAAGGSVEDLGDLDGVNMWQHLMENTFSPREEVVFNIDSMYGMFAIRQGDYKLIQGSYPGGKDFWYGPSGTDDVTVESMDAWVWKDGSEVKRILEETGKWLIKTEDEWRQTAVVNCGKEFTPEVHGNCDPKRSPCLFNVASDPCEYFNLAPLHPEIVNAMLKRVKHLDSESHKLLWKPVDIRADPRCHGFVYVPWLDEEHISDCLSV